MTNNSKVLINLLSLDIYYYKLKEANYFQDSKEKNYLEFQIENHKSILRNIDNPNKYKDYLTMNVSSINQFGTISDIQRCIERRINKYGKEII